MKLPISHFPQVPWFCLSSVGLQQVTEKEVAQQTKLIENKCFFYGKEIQQNLSASFLNDPRERVIYKYYSECGNGL